MAMWKGVWKNLQIKYKAVGHESTLYSKFCDFLNIIHKERGKLLTEVIPFLNVIFPKVELY
jgi:hypothetical protein